MEQRRISEPESVEGRFVGPEQTEIGSVKHEQPTQDGDEDQNPPSSHSKIKIDDDNDDDDGSSYGVKKIKLENDAVKVEDIKGESLPHNDTETVYTSLFRQKSDELTNAFGSAQKQRAVRSRNLNIIRGEALDAAMDATLNASLKRPLDESKNKSAIEESHESELLPPHDKEASYPQDVYKLKDLITPFELRAMRDYAIGVVHATDEDIENWKEQYKYGYFVINHIIILPLEVEKRTETAAQLAYLDIMIKLYRARVSEIKKIPAFSQAPQCVKSKLLSEFTVTCPSLNGRPQLSQPKRLKDKLLLHILILAMIIDDYRLQIAELMMDLSLNQRAITAYLRAIGAEVKKSAQKSMGKKVLQQITLATIPIPVTFPKAKAQKAKR